MTGEFHNAQVSRKQDPTYKGVRQYGRSSNNWEIAFMATEVKHVMHKDPFFQRVAK